VFYSIEHFMAHGVFFSLNAAARVCNWVWDHCIKWMFVLLKKVTYSFRPMVFVVMKYVESEIWRIIVPFQFIAVRAFEERRLARRFRRGRISSGLRSIGLRRRIVDSRIAFIWRWWFGVDIFFRRFFISRFCCFVISWLFVWFLWLVESGTKLKLNEVI